MSDIVVVGSINVDMVSCVERFPVPGETLKCRSTEYYHGGKGANQAVAAARAGGKVAMVGAVGTDAFGEGEIRSLQEQGVETGLVAFKSGPTGMAYIMVSDDGENVIVLTEGANGMLAPTDVVAGAFDKARIILLQNEIRWETNVHVMELAREKGIDVIFNPAPALTIPAEVLPLINTLVLNETEAETIVGRPVRSHEEARAASLELIEKGVREVIVTLGERGCLYCNHAGVSIEQPAFQVQAVDTTSAGDTMIGYYAACIGEGMPVRDALKWASAAAAIAVTRSGAQSSIPERAEVDRLVNNFRTR
ncbi:ribokinase [Paenibacillus koleovorans]|uniref:ribokinase n=1 Tax=Paenibacillus koleovorans TaxID=121608 RepID=UPI000FDAA721|nr:ribokinase [Paenibacillus koleovorans]